ncbi:hypothetical protein [Streptomyces justiciae]|uniref:Secreted protein n=1 Tax=Streptomyces justiciae TaxID=2780140 RepID=A0ABU3LKJ8_9ACTN|nr:hypothetical protein [Streptomyces justiciae]MDT7839710.1 hypothetical protein [Streptomyces justiciae]
MDAFMPYLILIGGLVAALGFFTWLASRIRRRGLAGGAMSAALASYEEAFRITAHESHVEIAAQAERRAPLLSPDDHWRRSPGGAGEEDTEGRSRMRPRPRRSRRSLGRWVDRVRGGR